MNEEKCLTPFESIYHHSADTVLLLKEGLFVDCNLSAVEMLHADSKEAILDTHPSMLSPEIQPDGRASYEKAEEMMKLCLEKGSHRFQWMHKRLDGEDFWAEVVLTSLVLEGETAIHASLRDINAQKKRAALIASYHELLLEQAESKSYSFQDSIQRATEISAQALNIERSGIWLFKPEDHRLDCQDNYSLSMKVHSHDIRITEAMCPLYFKSLRDGKPLIVNDARTDPLMSELQEQFIRPYDIYSVMDIPIVQKGSVVGVVCFGAVGSIKEWTGEEQEFAFSIAQMLSHSFSMAERVEAEQRINRISNLLDNSQTIVFCWKAEASWPVEYVSENITLFGYTTDEFYSGEIKYADIIHPDDIRQVVEEVMAYSENGTKNFTQIYRILTASGEIRWIDDRTVVERDEEGKVIYYLGTIIDITPQKEAELLSTKRFEENLEQTRMLAQQTKLASMGEMISNIAHQWRQPLNVLSLLFQKLEILDNADRLSTEQLHQTVAKGVGVVNKMSSTIDDFRYFFQPNKAKQLFSVLESVKETENLLSSTLSGYGITIDMDVQSKLQIDGYKSEFSQVLLNIMGNARDACMERTVVDAKIDISAAEENDNVVLTISNNGGSIPEASMIKIFEPYFTTKEEGKGTGIGLYMSKIIIQEHMDGTLEVENIEDGVCFTITVPSAQARG